MVVRGNNERYQWLVDVAMVERCNGNGRGRGGVAERFMAECFMAGRFMAGRGGTRRGKTR